MTENCTKIIYNHSSFDILNFILNVFKYKAINNISLTRYLRQTISVNVITKTPL